MDRTPDLSASIERTKSWYLENILGVAFPVLDHGFIRVIDYMGDDNAIDEAARVSYGAGTKRTSEAQGLINYLMAHDHTSPFEMCEIKFHLKLPIFVMRQLVRQRMASLNEYSGRYSVMKDEFYIPSLEQIRQQSTDNKQGRGEEVPRNQSGFVKVEMEVLNERAHTLYEFLISDDVNLAREIARISLPISIYTECYWKIDLHNLFKFLKARTDSHAQYEIRVYADIMETMIQQWVPIAYTAFVNHKKSAISFSGSEQKVLRIALASPSLLDPEIVPEYPGVSFTKREWRDFVAKVQTLL